MKSTVIQKKPKKNKTSAAEPRVRSTPKHRSLRLSKKRLKQYRPVPSAIQLFKGTFRVVKNNKRLFLGITIINALISFIFIKGLGSSFDIVGLKNDFNSVVDGQSGSQFGTATALFGYLLGSAGSNASDTAGVYQVLLTIISGLAIIWVVRQIQAGEKPGIRDGYYKGMYPLIPFIFVLLVIGLQLLPLLLGNLMYTTVIQNGLAISVAEKLMWLLLFLLLALLSGYMILSSVFSLYIVTLPDMTPLRALRSARELVLHRRLGITLRLLALPLVLAVVSAIIFIPLIIVAAPIVEALFLIVTSMVLIIVHTYMYLLYRSLL